MITVRRGPEPDPRAASDQAEFRASLRKLMRWAGYSSLQQLEAGAARRGTSMPVSTANRALNAERLPTVDFVERMAVACGADVKRWLAARDTLVDRAYLLRPAATEPEQAPAEVCPYPGLAAFGPDEAQWFFGREKAVAHVLDLLSDRAGPLVISGPSGTGKSSLLRAGVLPALSAGRLVGSRDWAQVTLTPTVDPLNQLATRIAAHTSTSTDSHALAEALFADPSCLVEILRQVSDHGVVLVVDQFEEAFTLCPDERLRRAFIEALCAASTGDKPATPVVLGMRADFHGRCASYPGLVEALRCGQLLLGPMTEAELRDAVEKPAAVVGLQLQSGLVDVLLGDLGLRREDPSYQPGALPLLAHALQATWRQRDNRVLTIAGYQLIGGITGAIATTAERAYQRLTPQRQELARTLLLRMIQLGDGAADTRRRVDRARLVAESPDPDGAWAVLDTLTDARLVTAHSSAVEIVHEAVLTAWPRLRAWIDNDRAGLLAEQRLVAAAEAWDQDGRHESDLYQGPRLAAVLERAERTASTLPAPAPEFLRASVEREHAEQRVTARRTRRLRQLVALLSGLVLVAAVTTALTVKSRNDIAMQRNVGLSREVAGAAMALRVTDRDLAGQLAVAAHHLAPTAEARGAVLTTLVNLDPTRRTDVSSTGPVQAVAFSADGSLLVAASRDGFARVWRVGEPPSLAAPPIATLRHPDQVRSAAFDRAGRILATSGADGKVRLWSVPELGRHAAPMHELPGPMGALGPLAFSRDGTLLATGATPGTAVRLWRLTDPTKWVAQFGGHRHNVFTVAFDSTGRMLATAGADGTVKLWDITDPAHPVELWAATRRPGFISAVAFSPDGRLLAAGNTDASVFLWDIGRPDEPHELPSLGGFSGGVAGLAFDRTGRILATASYDNSAQLWDISDPGHTAALAVPLAGDADNLYSVAFHPDGHTLVTASHGQNVRLWETDAKRAAAQICARAFPPITREQLADHLPDRADEPPCPTPPTAVPASVAAGTTTLVATHSEKCLAIRAGVRIQDAPVHQFRCKGLEAAHWRLHRVTPSQHPAAYRISNTTTGMCLGTVPDERRFGAAHLVVQRPCTEDPDQLWQFQITAEQNGTSEGQFVSTPHGDCLDVHGAGIPDGTYLIRWRCTGDPNQVFRVNSDALGQ